MNTIKQQFKSVALILSMIILFQGCTVYKSTSVTLEEALRAETKVKLKTKNNQTLKFKRLKFEDGQYFGIKEIYKDDAFNQSKMEIIKIQFDVNDIEEIKIRDKTWSTILPFAIPIVLIGALIIGYTSPTW